MKISADFECILGLSKHVWEIQKKDTIGQEQLHKRQKLEASELCILWSPFWKKEVKCIPIYSYQYPLNYVKLR